MSFERIAAVTGPPAIPATVKFYYSSDKLFNSLALRTSMRANVIKDTKGETQLDDYSISQSEKSVVREMSEQAVFDVFSKMFKITEGVTSPIFIETSVTPSGQGAVAVIASGGSIKDNASFDANVLLNVDKKIENCIRYYILSEWYLMAAMFDDAKINRERYQSYVVELKSLLLQLRKPLMS